VAADPELLDALVVVCQALKPDAPAAAPATPQQCSSSGAGGEPLRPRGPALAASHDRLVFEAAVAESNEQARPATVVAAAGPAGSLSCLMALFAPHSTVSGRLGGRPWIVVPGRQEEGEGMRAQLAAVIAATPCGRTSASPCRCCHCGACR